MEYITLRNINMRGASSSRQPTYSTRERFLTCVTLSVFQELWQLNSSRRKGLY